MENLIQDIKTGNLLHKAANKEDINRLHAAILCYEAAISVNQENYSAYMSLGALYEQISDKKKALNTYKRGINVARYFNNKKIEKELSYTLLGLMD